MRHLHKLYFFCFLCLLFFSSSVFARPVLIELFTSQGCSSCPEGEKVVSRLNQREDFFALSFHVDYWDKLGWKDKFAQPQFSERQTGYMKKFNEKSIFTPQAVLDGTDEAVASWGWRIKMLASDLRSEQVDIPMHYTQKNGRERIKIPSYKILKNADIWYVTYLPQTSTDIQAGENSGRQMHSVNVVRSLEKLKVWQGQETEIKLPLKPEGLQMAVFIQEQGLGKVLGLYHP